MKLYNAGMKLSNEIIKVVVGLSGGVDSAVSAYLLKQQGYQVMAVYMQNWQADQDDPNCTAEQDLTDARSVADHLELPFSVINFSQAYWDSVFQRCLDEFAQGRTPNPDIWCNKEIKFKAFLKHALDLGADYLATGHYAKCIKTDHQQYQMHQAFDKNKDQTYFLYTLGQHELQHALFPLADLSKPEVRKIAKEIKLPNCDKKDSTGICFIGERKFKQFLAEYLLGKPGDIISTDGTVLGKHDGLMFHTLGQRKGLNIGGRQDATEAPWYVVAKDTETNQLIVGQGHDHPRLLSQTLRCQDCHWVFTLPTLPFACKAKVRYRQTEQPCRILSLTDDVLEVVFDEPQRAVTPGQAIVFYDNENCLGGATIQSSH